MQFNLLFRNRWWLLYLPVLAAAAALIWASCTRWAPLPPRTVAIQAGDPEGGYGDFARRYAARLEAVDVDVQIAFGAQWTTGDKHASSPGPAQVGFVQGLQATHLAPDVQALAAVAREPLWIITRMLTVNSVPQLKGLRVAVGPESSSNREIALKVLAAHNLKTDDLKLEPQQGRAALDALVDGQVDAVIQVLAVPTQAMQVALYTTGLQFIGLDQSETLRGREPRLRAMVLPQGAVELRGNVPPNDLAMLSTDTHLVVHERMHPALQRLLMRIAVDVHSVPSPLQRDHDYPRWSPVDIPLSPFATAKAINQHGFESALPYWWAQLAQLLLIFVLPIVLGTLLLLMWIPRLFDWRVDSALLHYYGELRYIDDELNQTAAEQPMALRSLMARIDEIEQAVSHIELPDAYAERWYTLRSHLAYTRERLLGLRAR